MSGRGRGKTKPKSKRHQVLKGREGISNPGYRRVARRAGIKRVSRDVYPQLSVFLDKWLGLLATNAHAYASHSRRKTITAKDIEAALKGMGRPIY